MVFNRKCEGVLMPVLPGKIDEKAFICLVKSEGKSSYVGYIAYNERNSIQFNPVKIITEWYDGNGILTL